MSFARYLAGVKALTIAYIKRFTREKIGLFFTFVFPVMFLLVFGSLNRNDSSITFDLALINNSQTEFAKQFEDQIKDQNSLKFNDQVTNLEEAKDYLGRGEIDSIIELPKEFGTLGQNNLPQGSVVVYYEEASPQSGQTLAAIMQGVLDKINQELTQTTPPLKVEQKSTATANLSPFDYIFSGLLGFTILSMGVFGLANSFPAEKKTGSFRRLRAAPMHSSQLIFANGLSYIFSGSLSVAFMYLVGLLVFDFNMRGDYLSFVLFTIFGIVLMFGVGLALSGWAKNEIQAAPLSNIVAFPMMFLSGAFFPRFVLPEWLQGVTGYLPLTPIVDGLRYILTEGKTILELGPQLALMAVWTVVIYIIAIKVFRWE